MDFHFLAGVSPTDFLSNVVTTTRKHNPASGFMAIPRDTEGMLWYSEPRKLLLVDDRDVFVLPQVFCTS